MAPRQPSAWDCRPSGPAGQAPPDPYRTGDTAPPLEVSVAPATCWPIGVGARRSPGRLPGPPPRRRLRGVKTRLRSSSRLKPADRDGAPQAATTLRPSQPPSGGLIHRGFSPGFDRACTIGNCTAAAIGVGFLGPAGQAPPDPYRTGDTAPPLEVSVAPATCWLIGVGARRCLARGASGAADCRGVYRPRAHPHRYRDHRSTTAFLALPGGRVGHPLIPTNGGSGAVPWRTRAPLGMRCPTM
jgi:hypothetical protein